MIDASAEPAGLERYRSYLKVLAGLHLDARLNGKLDASDIVQQTLFKAYAAREQLRSSDPQVVLGWLREILTNELADAHRRFRSDKRNIAREQALANDVSQSAAGLEQWVAASQTSPSVAAARNEELLRLANALVKLPEDQRVVVVLKHLHEWPLERIAAEVNRTVPSVAGLLRRGLAELRRILDQTSPP